MENSSSLTCILCNELVPAKEHTHNCKDEISVQIVKANLPKELPEHLKNVINNSENVFSIRAELSITQKCTCDRNMLRSIKRIWKICSEPSDGLEGVYSEPFGKCHECLEEEEDRIRAAVGKCLVSSVLELWFWVSKTHHALARIV